VLLTDAIPGIPVGIDDAPRLQELLTALTAAADALRADLLGATDGATPLAMAPASAGSGERSRRSPWG